MMHADRYSVPATTKGKRLHPLAIKARGCTTLEREEKKERKGERSARNKKAEGDVRKNWATEGGSNERGERRTEGQSEQGRRKPRGGSARENRESTKRKTEKSTERETQRGGEGKREKKQREALPAIVFVTKC
jgi:hypothetical protein